MKRIAWNKGKKWSPEIRQKISLAKLGHKPVPHLERRRGVLEELYLTKQLSAHDIAKQFGVGKTTIYRWLEEFSIKRRSNAEAHLTSLHKKQYAGKNHACYKTGKFTHAAGNYICINHNGKVVPRSRMVFEKALGRPLKPAERVHHMNKNRQDDRLENLVLFQNDVSHMLYHEYLELFALYKMGILPAPQEPTGFLLGKDFMP